MSYRTRVYKVSFLVSDDSGESEHEVRDIITTDVQDRLRDTLDPSNIEIVRADVEEVQVGPNAFLRIRR